VGKTSTRRGPVKGKELSVLAESLRGGGVSQDGGTVSQLAVHRIIGMGGGWRWGVTPVQWYWLTDASWAAARGRVKLDGSECV